MVKPSFRILLYEFREEMKRKPTFHEIRLLSLLQNSHLSLNYFKLNEFFEKVVYSNICPLDFGVICKDYEFDYEFDGGNEGNYEYKPNNKCNTCLYHTNFLECLKYHKITKYHQLVSKIIEQKKKESERP
jgi:hypothetical protein